jgi:hypothetical protein
VLVVLQGLRGGFVGTSCKTDADLLSGFLAHNAVAGYELRERFDARLLALVGPMPSTLAGLGLEEDVLQRSWELVFLAGPEAYDRTRGEVINYLEGHGRNAKRDVCAAHAPPGQPTRQRKDAAGMTIPWKPTVPLEATIVTSAGEEVALAGALTDPVDEIARVIDEIFVDELIAEAGRMDEPLAIDLLGRMREERRLSEAAAELGVSRFTARRALDRLATALSWAA